MALPTEKGVFSGSQELLNLIGAKQCANLASVAVIDSYITDKGIEHLHKQLMNPKCTLVALNLKYCYLRENMFNSFSRAVQANRSLVKLDLSHNAMRDPDSVKILRALRENLFLSEINFSHNQLSD